MTAAAARPSTPAAGPRPGLASEMAPPFVLPGEHFAAAVVFLLLGAGGLVLVAPELAGGAYLSPRVAGVTHLFTLGWITTSIMGALCQFLPVALGVPIGSVRLAHATFALYVPGVALFAWGLVAGSPVLPLAGAALLGTGVLLFVGNLAASLGRAARRDVTWWALAFAAGYLTVTLVLGLALAGNLRWGYLGAGRTASLATHLHVAAAGWVLLVMTGVAHRLLPMFLLSHGAGDRAAKWAVGLLAAGAGTLALLHHAPPLAGRWLPAALLAAGVVAFLAQARAFYRQRHRPVLDPAMRLAAAALAGLGVALALAWPGVLRAADPRVSAAYGAALVLALALFVAAFYYKIVPFLVWLHRFGPLAARQPVPRVAELYSAAAASSAAALLVTGAAVLVAGTALGEGALARAGAVLVLGGAATEGGQMLALALRKP